MTGIVKNETFELTDIVANDEGIHLRKTITHGPLITDDNIILNLTFSSGLLSLMNNFMTVEKMKILLQAHVTGANGIAMFKFDQKTLVENADYDDPYYILEQSLNFINSIGYTPSTITGYVDIGNMIIDNMDLIKFNETIHFEEHSSETVYTPFLVVTAMFNDVLIGSDPGIIISIDLLMKDKLTSIIDDLDDLNSGIETLNVTLSNS